MSIPKPSKPTYRKMTQGELIQVYEALKRAGHVENGFYKYKEGNSDKTVALSVASDLSVYSVQDVRRKQFGRLFEPGSNPQTKEEIIARIDELETLSLKIIERLDALENKPKLDGLF